MFRITQRCSALKGIVTAITMSIVFLALSPSVLEAQKGHKKIDFDGDGEPDGYAGPAPGGGVHIYVDGSVNGGIDATEGGKYLRCHGDTVKVAEFISGNTCTITISIYQKNRFDRNSLIDRITFKNGSPIDRPGFVPVTKRPPTIHTPDLTVVPDPRFTKRSPSISDNIPPLTLDSVPPLRISSTEPRDYFSTPIPKDHANPPKQPKAPAKKRKARPNEPGIDRPFDTEPGIDYWQTEPGTDHRFDYSDHDFKEPVLPEGFFDPPKKRKARLKKPMSKGKDMNHLRDILQKQQNVGCDGLSREEMQELLNWELTDFSMGEATDKQYAAWLKKDWSAFSGGAAVGPNNGPLNLSTGLTAGGVAASLNPQTTGFVGSAVGAIIPGGVALNPAISLPPAGATTPCGQVTSSCGQVTPPVSVSMPALPPDVLNCPSLR